MSEPIAPGDLVIVVKPSTCCGDMSNLGEVFRVAMITSGTISRCDCCHHQSDSSLAWDSHEENAKGYELVCLKRIPPIGQLTQVTSKHPRKVQA